MILRIIVNTILFAAMLFAGQAYGAKYSFTKGTINGAKQAAKDILNNNGYCRSITQDKLTALMLSIPPWEILGGNATLGSPSPMVLGRGDTWAMYDNNGNQTPRGKENERLYSDNDPDHFRRAHWNPGVGIWQLDDVSSPWNLYNHYQ